MFLQGTPKNCLPWSMGSCFLILVMDLQLFFVFFLWEIYSKQLKVNMISILRQGSMCCESIQNEVLPTQPTSQSTSCSPILMKKYNLSRVRKYLCFARFAFQADSKQSSNKSSHKLNLSSQAFLKTLFI